jgi:hypothetical protein
METEVTAADLLVLAPWLIFGAALAAICYRLLVRRGACRRQPRSPVMGTPAWAWAADGCVVLACPSTARDRDQPGCARDIHPSSIARTSPLRMGGLSKRQGLIARPLTTMR